MPNNPYGAMGAGMLPSDIGTDDRYGESPLSFRRVGQAIDRATDRDPFGYQGKLGGVAREGEDFARQSRGRFEHLGGVLTGDLDQTRKWARGDESVSAMQLAQALQRNQAMQQSMAAGARPGNQAMAARQAMMNAGQQGAALAGQQALAGIQERQGFNRDLINAQLQQRQQELAAAGQGQAGALGGYGAAYTGALNTPTNLEKVLGFAQDGLSAYAKAQGAG